MNKHSFESCMCLDQTIEQSKLRKKADPCGNHSGVFIVHDIFHCYVLCAYNYCDIMWCERVWSSLYNVFYAVLSSSWRNTQNSSPPTTTSATTAKSTIPVPASKYPFCKCCQVPPCWDRLWLCCLIIRCIDTGQNTERGSLRCTGQKLRFWGLHQTFLSESVTFDTIKI